MKKYKIVRYKKKTLYSELEVVYLDQWPSWPRPRRLQCANQTRYPSFYIIPVAGTLSPPAGHYGNCSENGRTISSPRVPRKGNSGLFFVLIGPRLVAIAAG